ncbi:MAG TPA: multiheme c-type cytochrome [Vicinamibacterales bacterium]|nr:multiheme c-type cytochrome [Vicinamibacterales bacterium]
MSEEAADGKSPQGAPASGSFTGPGSCAAAACHGSIRPVAGSRILQTEYTTWIAQDRHARASEVLSNPVSVRMAGILGIGAAHTASKCLACHSLEVADAQQARSFADEGVSCEACHGPASGWLGPHTTKDWTHLQSVALGMYDTKDPVKRTERCLTCHLGTARKFVDHEMIAAGHPDLVFDLEAFSAAMPRHWRAASEADPFAPVRSFSIGQLVHLRSSLDRLAQRVTGPVWPEYAELDCFACHHSLTRAEDSWRQAQGYENRRPGNPALNLSRWTTARHVLAALDEPAARELNEVMSALARDGSRLRVDSKQVVGHIERARAILDRGIARAVASKPDARTGTALLRAIASEAEAIAARGERSAEQAAMALETLYTASATRESSPAVRALFDELFQQFQSPSSFDPRRFVAQVRKVEGAIGATR